MGLAGRLWQSCLLTSAHVCVFRRHSGNNGSTGNVSSCKDGSFFLAAPPRTSSWPLSRPRLIDLLRDWDREAGRQADGVGGATPFAPEPPRRSALFGDNPEVAAGCGGSGELALVVALIASVHALDSRHAIESLRCALDGGLGPFACRVIACSAQSSLARCGVGIFGAPFECPTRWQRR